MRQFLFGLSVAALGWWIWSSWDGEAGQVAEAGPQPGAPASGGPGGAADLVSALRGDETGAGAPSSPLAVGAPDPDAETPAAEAPDGNLPDGKLPDGKDPQIQAAFEVLVAQIENGDEAARGQALRVLGDPALWPEHRSRLRELLQLDAAEDASDRQLTDTLGGGKATAAQLDQALVRLGTGNGFLHSAEGRDLGQRVLELLAQADDETATAAGSRLLERCMQGTLENDDDEALAFVMDAYRQHRERADRFLCDPANLARARSYTVQSGNTLGSIASRFRKEGIMVDQACLAILNRIHNPDAIQVGQRIKVPVDPIGAVLEKRSYLFAVYVGDSILRLYRVGHGTGSKTPVTKFRVSEKLENPDWNPPGGGVVPYGHPDNILGDYFMKFEHPSYTGFGAHGTPQPETIGTMSSMGCIRMYKPDIEELCCLLPRGAVVEIRETR